MSKGLIDQLRYCSRATTCEGCPFGFEGCQEDLMKDAADAIEQLSNAGSAYGRGWTLGYDAGREESKPRWIPVTERLPERGYYVLVYEDGDILMASYADGNWVLRDMYEVIDDLKPTYWMPLPEPPKEE